LKRKIEIFPVRPIGARALKSAIDTLRPEIIQSNILDLFCGQGRFALAAAKAGAHSITAVDSNASLIKIISNQATKQKLPLSAITSDVHEYLRKASKAGGKFHVIFADPPFPLWTTNFENELFNAVSGVALSEAIFLVKAPKAMIAFGPRTQWKLIRTTVFGESQLIYYRYDEPT